MSMTSITFFIQIIVRILNQVQYSNSYENCIDDLPFQHEFKKLRNSLLSSDLIKKTITYDSDQILWQHWIDAFKWDQDSHCIKIYHHLTKDHIFLDGPAKMRNHLANEVLDKNMLHLMQVNEITYKCLSLLKVIIVTLIQGS
jgi:hypothetical protein